MLDVFIDSVLKSTMGQTILNIVLLILCLYPIVGSFFWFACALSYRFLKTNKRDTDWQNIPAEQQPMITIMIPAHNEEVMLADTITYLFEELNYENFEVLVMNDGSTDRTAAIISDLQTQYPRLRTIEILKNKGKAHAFNIGMHFAQGDYILSNDADTIPEPDALMKYMNFFMRDRDMNTSAVTANMDVQNRTSLLGKSQTVEFTSIVGVIKRSQTAINDSMYAYSGANTLYKKDFLIDVGGFRQNRATEDISIAWDHQMIGAVPRFAPNVIFHMNVPDTLRDLYKQRKRWAQGGTEVWLTNIKKFILHPVAHRYQFSMFIDSTLSIVWSFFFMLTSLAFLTTMGIFLITGNYDRVLHGLAMSFIFVTFELFAGFMQLLAALLLDHHGVKLKYLFFAPLYMLFYWMVNPVTVVMTFIPALKTILGFGSGTWVSPKRQALKK
ncbi:glycosyltransferase family 2 protein [Levilactobacillus brevis]|uniref:glycosyltransferase family 2 protein n=1 Tax=Levilactobacillus brevis TaxID=1580 RepID=UPI001F21BF0E|nr:glycosyltransferase [Levilactobacillus brevis]MCE6013812.1 glycosyltransferase [Levilactobacillus brevis]MCE6016172.1 glycosyltransferase [Levilactobacillus brevis]MCE6018588.1 glycosyltransferase [Levilactobacillus brevis]MCE6021078.1 glycosyltransferase [Levilactobacillus brevis]MCE6023503.1 glycosyltransferase [Levilactobacillus brevis]